MTISERKALFERRYKHRELVYDATWISVLIMSVIGAEIYTWLSVVPRHHYLMLGFALSLVLGAFTLIMTPIDRYMRRTLLKPYFIEMEQGVIKLYGAVGVNDRDRAYRDVLSHGEGYMIADNAYERYGCTIAAIKASPEALSVKRMAEAIGVKVPTIS